MNADLDLLQPYPFEKLHSLFKGLAPAPDHQAINLGIGEPQHPAPEFVLDVLRQQLPKVSKYPATRGITELREAIAGWLAGRFTLPAIDPESQVLPVSGTREGLFAIAQALIDRSDAPLVLCPNPFYQIYEGAALLAGAELGFLDCRAATGFIPDFEKVSEAQWRRCQLLYICNPGNPSGAVMSLSVLEQLVRLADRYDFTIVSDECYSEIYDTEDRPPPGLLQACISAGLPNYRNCLVFHSLSKRSNLPGLRSGFVAGEARLIEAFLRYRTYHGCAMPVHHQWASQAAWSDEAHVIENRLLYREKFDAVCDTLKGVLEFQRPEAGFYLWPETAETDTDFARALYRQFNLTVLPGQFLGRDAGSGNPGAGRVRLALVPELEDCMDAARRIREYCEIISC